MLQRVGVMGWMEGKEGMKNSNNNKRKGTASVFFCIKALNLGLLRGRNWWIDLMRFSLFFFLFFPP